MRRFLVMLLVAGSAWIQLWAQAPPKDGIHDDTHALSEASRKVLIQEMNRARNELGINFWLRADTFLSEGKSLKTLARESRLAWSGEAEAVLLAFERSKDSLSLSFSPGIWERYPSARLAQAVQQCGLIMSNTAATSESRLRDAMLVLVQSFQQMEKERELSVQTFGKTHQTLAQVFAGGLLIACAVALVLGILTRRRDVKAAWQSYFPPAQVALLLGAPCGGFVRGLSIQSTRDA